MPLALDRGAADTLEGDFIYGSGPRGTTGQPGARLIRPGGHRSPSTRPTDAEGPGPHDSRPPRRRRRDAAADRLRRNPCAVGSIAGHGRSLATGFDPGGVATGSAKLAAIAQPRRESRAVRGAVVVPVAVQPAAIGPVSPPRPLPGWPPDRGSWQRPPARHHVGGQDPMAVPGPRQPAARPAICGRRRVHLAGRPNDRRQR